MAENVKNNSLALPLQLLPAIAAEEQYPLVPKTVLPEKTVIHTHSERGYFNALARRVNQDWKGKLTNTVFAIPEVLAQLPFLTEVSLMILEAPAVAFEKGKNPEEVQVSLYRDRLHLWEQYAFGRGAMRWEVNAKQFDRLKDLKEVEEALQTLTKAKTAFVQEGHYDDQVAGVLKQIRLQLEEKKLAFLVKDKKAIDLKISSTPGKGPANLEMRFTEVEHKNGKTLRLLSRDNLGAWVGYELNFGKIDKDVAEDVAKLIERFEKFYSQVDAKPNARILRSLSEAKSFVKNSKNYLDKAEDDPLWKVFNHESFRKLFERHLDKADLPGVQEVLSSLEDTLKADKPGAADNLPSERKPHKLEGKRDGMLTSAPFRISVQGNAIVLESQKAMLGLPGFKHVVQLDSSFLNSEDSLAKIIADFAKMGAALQKTNNRNLNGQFHWVIGELIQLYVSSRGARLIYENVPFSGAQKLPHLDSLAAGESLPDIATPGAHAGNAAQPGLTERLTTEPELAAFYENLDVNQDGQITLMELGEEGLKQLFRLRHDPQKQEAYRAVRYLMSGSEKGAEALAVFDFIDRNNNGPFRDEPESIVNWSQVQIRVLGRADNFTRDYLRFNRLIPNFAKLVEPFFSPELKAQITRNAAAQNTHRAVNGAVASWQLNAVTEPGQKKLAQALQQAGDKPDATVESLLNSSFADFSHPDRTASQTSVRKTYNDLKAQGGTHKANGYLSVYNDRELRLDQLKLKPVIGHLLFWMADFHKLQETVLDLQHPFPATASDYKKLNQAKEILAHWKKALEHDYLQEAYYFSPRSLAAHEIAAAESRLLNFVVDRPADFTDNAALGQFIFKGKGQTLWLKVDQEGQIEAVRGFKNGSDKEPEFSVYLRGRYSLTPEVSSQIEKALAEAGNSAGLNDKKKKLLEQLKEQTRLAFDWRTSEDWREGQLVLVRGRTAQSGHKAARLEVGERLEDGRVLTSIRLIAWNEGKTAKDRQRFADVTVTLGSTQPPHAEDLKNLKILLEEWKNLRGKSYDADDKKIVDRLQAKLLFLSEHPLAPAPKSDFISPKLSLNAQQMEAAATTLAETGRMDLAAETFLAEAKLIMAYGEVTTEGASIFSQGALAAQQAFAKYQALFQAQPELAQKQPALYQNYLQSALLEGIFWTLAGDLSAAQVAVANLALLDAKGDNRRTLESQLQYNQLNQSVQAFKKHADSVIAEAGKRLAKSKTKNNVAKPDSAVPNPLSDPETRAQLTQGYLQNLQTHFNAHLNHDLYEIISRDFAADPKNQSRRFHWATTKEIADPLLRTPEYFALNLLQDVEQLTQAVNTAGLKDRATGVQSTADLLKLQVSAELIQQARQSASLERNGNRPLDTLLRQGLKNSKSLAEEALALLVNHHAQAQDNGDHEFQVTTLQADLQRILQAKGTEKHPERFLTDSLRRNLLENGISAREMDHGHYVYAVSESADDSGSRGWRRVDLNDPAGRDGISDEEIWDFVAQNPDTLTDSLLRTSGLVSPFWSEKRIASELSLYLTLFAQDENSKLSDAEKAALVFAQVVQGSQEARSSATLEGLFHAYQLLLALVRHGELKINPQFIMNFPAGAEPLLGLGLFADDASGHKVFYALGTGKASEKSRIVSPREAMSQFFTQTGENALAQQAKSASTQSKNALHAALEIDKNNLRALRSLTRNYLEDGTQESRAAALAQLERYGSRLADVQAAPYLNAQVLLLKALVLIEDKKPADALPMIRRALELQPNDARAQDLLKQAQSGNVSKRQAFWQRRENEKSAAGAPSATPNNGSALNELIKKSYYQAFPLLNATQQGLSNYTLAEHAWVDARQHLGLFLKNYRERTGTPEEHGHFSQAFHLTPTAAAGLNSQEKIAIYHYFAKIGWKPSLCVRGVKEDIQKAGYLEYGRNAFERDTFLSIKLSPPGLAGDESVFLEDLFEENGRDWNLKQRTLETRILWDDNDGVKKATAFIAVENAFRDNRFLQMSNTELLEIVTVLSQNKIFTAADIRTLSNEIAGKPATDQKTLLQIKLREHIEKTLGLKLGLGETHTRAKVIRLPGSRQYEEVKVPAGFRGYLEVADEALAQGNTLFEQATTADNAAKAKISWSEAVSFWTRALESYRAAYEQLGLAGQRGPSGPTLALKVAESAQALRHAPSGIAETRSPDDLAALDEIALDYYEKALAVLLPVGANGGQNQKLTVQGLLGLGEILQDMVSGGRAYTDKIHFKVVQIERALSGVEAPEFVQNLPAFKSRAKAADLELGAGLEFLTYLSYQAALQLQPENEKALLGSAMMLHRFGQEAGQDAFAKLLFEEGSLSQTQKASLYLQRGDLELRLGHREKASQALFKALELGVEPKEGIETLRRIFALYAEWAKEDPRYYEACFPILTDIQKRRPEFFSPQMRSIISFYRVWYGTLSQSKNLSEINQAFATHLVNEMRQNLPVFSARLKQGKKDEIAASLDKVNQFLAQQSPLELLRSGELFAAIDGTVEVLASQLGDDFGRMFLDHLHRALFEAGNANLRYASQPFNKDGLELAEKLFKASLKVLNVDAAKALLHEPVPFRNGSLQPLPDDQVAEVVADRLNETKELSRYSGIDTYQAFFDTSIALAQTQQALGQKTQALALYEQLFEVNEEQNNPSQAQMQALKNYVPLALELYGRNERQDLSRVIGTLDAKALHLEQLRAQGKGIPAEYVSLLFNSQAKLLTKRGDAEDPQKAEQARLAAVQLNPFATHAVLRKAIDVHIDLTLRNYATHREFGSKAHSRDTQKILDKEAEVYIAEFESAIRSVRKLSTEWSGPKNGPARAFYEAQKPAQLKILHILAFIQASKVESGNHLYSLDQNSDEAKQIREAFGNKTPSLLTDEAKQLSDKMRKDPTAKDKVLLLALWSFDRLIEASAENNLDQMRAYRMEITHAIRVLKAEGDEFLVSVLVRMEKSLSTYTPEALQERLREQTVEVGEVINKH